MRLKGQEQAGTAVNRPTGARFDLFTYDYPELNFPVRIDTSSTVTFVAEVYDARNATKVWSIDSLTFDNDTVESTVSEQAGIITGEILGKRLVER